MKSRKKILAIIPARGGSQRIKNKNIVDFHGKPMILYSIIAALESKLFDKIIISTDSILIKDVCEKAGFSVPFLRNENFDNHSTVSQATITAINQTQEYFNESYDIVVQLMPNSPLRTFKDILNQFEFFKKQQASFSISCTRFGWQNPWWSFEKNDANIANWKFSEALNKRSQDLSELYSPNGAIWIANVNDLTKTKSFYTPITKFFEMDFINSVDIDTIEDLNFARKLYSIKDF